MGRYILSVLHLSLAKRDTTILHVASIFFLTNT